MVMSDFLPKEYELAQQGANLATGASRSSSLVEKADLIAEAYMWMVTHEKKVLEWREKGKLGQNMLRLSCKRAALKIIAKERKRITSAEYSDFCFYNPQMIRELMPSIFDTEDWSGGAGAMSNEPKSQAAPAEGNSRLAMIVDVRGAYHHQPTQTQHFLKRMYDNPATDVQDVIAEEEGVSVRTIQRRDQRYMEFMVAFLGGDNPWERVD